jgi:hypothetical protein
MAIISDVDLQVFSDLAVDLALKDSCEILRDTSTDSDDQGGYENIPWPTVATVACALVDVGAVASYRPTVEATRLQDRVYQTLLLPRGTGVLVGDRFRINSASTYQSEGIQDPTSYEVLRRVQVWRERN